MSPTAAWTIYESPLGALKLVGTPTGIRSIYFPGRSPRLSESARQPLKEATDQLDQYFAGERRSFELQLDLMGTPFQKLVWEQLLQIPYGTTISYGELARQIDSSAYPDDLEPYRRVRLAAATVGRTPTPILVPCHRVIGADGSLTGYGGGLPRKQALLDLEAGGTTGRPVQPSSEPHQLALISSPPGAGA